MTNPSKNELLQKSFGDERWRKPSTGRTCTLAMVGQEIQPDDDDSPDEDAPSTDEDSTPQAHPTEASPVGGATASQPTESPRANGSFPPTVPACTQEQSNQFLKGITGFCEYAKWRLKVVTQNCEFVLKLLLLGVLTRRGFYRRYHMSCPSDNVESFVSGPQWSTVASRKNIVTCQTHSASRLSDRISQICLSTGVPH